MGCKLVEAGLQPAAGINGQVADEVCKNIAVLELQKYIRCA